MEQEIKAKLEKYPLFRERHLRTDYLTILALRKEHLEGKWKAEEHFNLKEMARFGATFSSYDRAWRKVLKENKDLRGKDYDEKQVLEEQKMLELGYSPNFQGDIAKLKTLT